MKGRVMESTAKRLRILAIAIGWSCLTGIMLQVQPSEGTSLPPATCSDGNSSCSIHSAYRVWPDRDDCKAASVVYPTTEEELVVAVAHAVKAGQKMRVVSRGSHSIPKLVCPGGDAGLSISTRDYNQQISVDEISLTATLDAGVRLKVFFDTIAEKGLAFPHSPYWAGLSISGVLGTGAHGSSSWGKGSALYEYVTGMRMVVPASAKEGYAKVITLVDGDRDLNAAKVSLGVLGVISKVTLQLEPMFKRSVSFVQQDDGDLEIQIAANAEANEFGEVSWFPGLNIAIYREDNRVNVSESGEGTNDFTGFIGQPIIALEAIRSLEESFEAVRDSEGKCEAGLVQLGALSLIGKGWTNDGVVFLGWPVTGYQNMIQASGSCDDASYEAGLVCGWDTRNKGEFFHQTTFSISFDRIADFVQDVKALVAARPAGLCGLSLYSGILMRYKKKSSGAYLGEINDSVDLDFTYFRSYNASTPRLDEDVMEEVEQMMMLKYEAKPHWGKNRPVGFLTAPTLFPDLAEFLEVKRRYDPHGLFSNEWTDAVLNVDGAASTLQTLQPFCALEGLCICSEDLHCAPDSGYFCRPGLVFTDARVCRFIDET